ncbi:MULTISPECIES: FadR/GntR family transcriptional regulator [Aeribacillus]|uniref:GntR family transcriptional regulator n=1 Tax=Aeribacillus pallidus TaxID=33936 RepID=A0A223E5W0_9BACI|nr:MULTISPECIES: FadR/GntR family transcriptional regulator [Bacillaceae]ASS90662.1 GntR family transcriptional regulator [Aeribacillus pallidus]
MKIERKKISSQVLEELKKMIKENKFAPNQPLPSENELAMMFGVSRAPVREALSVLAASGIIESRQGGRSYIKQVDLSNMLEPITFEMIPIDQIYELLEMRIIMETQAASLAAIRHDEKALTLMEKALENFYMTITNPNEVGDQADVEFHKQIVHASRNRFLIQTFENIDELYRKSIAFSLKKNIGLTAKRIQVYEEHQKIFLAIKDRDEKQAAIAMKVHLENVMSKFKALEQ